MMNGLVDPLLVVVVLLNFFLLGTSRLRAVITVSALQGIVVGISSALVHSTLSFQPLLVAVISIFIKGFLIPALLVRAMRDARIRREIEPLIGYVPSLLLGALGTGLAVYFAKTLPLGRQSIESSLVLPAAIATVITGFLILTTRRKAITQVVGYLVLENGIYIMGLVLIEAVPFLVELGVLLDLFVGIFVMGIIINHISREFSSLDTEHLRRLKE
jgi:hydrogenase-4 component E